MKRYFYFKVFFLIFSFFLCITNVSAKECTTEEYRELKQLAKKIELSYEFDEVNKYFRVELYNLKKGLEINLGYNNYTYTIKNKGIVQLNSTYFGGYKLELEVYASKQSNCEGEYLYTIKEQLPIYNIFYTRAECKGFENEKICRKWFDYTSFSEEKFLEKINELKQNEKEQKNDFWDVVLTYAFNFWYIPLIIVLFVVGILVFKRIREEKNKKIDL